MLTPCCHAEDFNTAALEADLSSDSEFARFKEAAERGNLVPLYERIFADQLSPVTAYRCLVAEDDREAPSFLFESVVNGTQTVWSSFHLSHILVQKSHGQYADRCLLSSSSISTEM